MRLILNIIWLVFGGLWLALGYLLAALICFVLIITIPFGFASLRIASYALWPFGRTVIDKPGTRPGALIGNVIWVHPVRHLAGHRPCRHRGRDGDHDHRHPAGAGQPQADPGLAGAAGQGDRARSTTSSPPRSASRRMTVIALGVPSVPRPVGPAPADGPLLDTYGRVATDLRVSLTDRCNLRCTYCMPAEGLDWMSGDQLLSVDELTRLLRIAVTRLGITSVRFTGGEPLLAKQLEDIVAATAALASSPRNHVDHQRDWADRRGRGPEAAPAWTGSTSRSTPSTPNTSRTSPAATGSPTCWPASPRRTAPGLTPVKVNAVLDPVTGLDDAVTLLRFCLDHGYQLRIIEQMPLDAGHEWHARQDDRRRRRAGRAAPALRR